LGGLQHNGHQSLRFVSSMGFTRIPTANIVSPDNVFCIPADEFSPEEDTISQRVRFSSRAHTCEGRRVPGRLNSCLSVALPDRCAKHASRGARTCKLRIVFLQGAHKPNEVLSSTTLKTLIECFCTTHGTEAFSCLTQLATPSLVPLMILRGTSPSQVFVTPKF
jgi:hypothetical protein